MKINEIVEVKEYQNSDNEDLVNDLLSKGWILLHVGTKTVGTYNEHLDYVTTYVLGATRETLDKHPSTSKLEEALDTL